MKAIHKTDSVNEPFEIVEVIKNPISHKNGMALIKNSEGKIQMTGGLLFQPIEWLIEALNVMPADMQYDMLRELHDRCQVISWDLSSLTEGDVEELILAGFDINKNL